LKRAIGSVLSQTADDIELVVVDDASSDNTREVIKAFGDSRLRFLVHETNQGAAAARNTGIAAAKADLIAFQDSDDEWMPYKLQRQLDLISSSGPDVVAVYCGFIRYHRQKAVYEPNPTIAPRQGDLAETLLEGNFITTSTLLVWRDKLLETGVLDPTLPRFQDWDLVIRLSELGYFRLIDEPLVMQHVTPGSLSSNGLAGAKALEIMHKKYKDRLRVNPRGRASFCYVSGREHCLHVSTIKGRHYLKESLTADPWRPKTWLALGLSYFGSHGFQSFCSLRRRLRSLDNLR
jgi:glycosyltransferase involved in cell wall biosynthesis